MIMAHINEITMLAIEVMRLDMISEDNKFSYFDLLGWTSRAATMGWVHECQSLATGSLEID